MRAKSPVHNKHDYSFVYTKKNTRWPFAVDFRVLTAPFYCVRAFKCLGGKTMVYCSYVILFYCSVSLLVADKNTKYSRVTISIKLA